MNVLKYFLVGFLFGIVLTKSEAVSWYRIYEMFHFQSFHMYGIIGVAVVTGILGIQIIKRKSIKDIKGLPIEFMEKDKGTARYMIGGISFGLGWALVGSCPGPIFILIGAGFLPVIIVLAGAFRGTVIYGAVKSKLTY